MTLRSIALLGFAALVCFCGRNPLSADPATKPASTEPPAPTERQSSLLLQLSDAEANIKTINQALVRTGYKVSQAYDHIDSNQKGNELMDRKGGAPVAWDQFYGKTASSFYYHSSATVRSDIGRGAAVTDAQVNGGDLTRIARPRQFDYIYKANNQQIERAKQQIASLEKDQAALLARRQQHEADQSRLWATLAWEQVKDREIPFRPLYRFALKPADVPEAHLLRPAILFLRTSDQAITVGLESLPADQDGTFADLQQRARTAYAALQQSLADALLAPQLTPDQRKQADAIKALCKQATEECTVIAENYAKAMESERAKEDGSKLEFRAQLQSSLARLAATTAELDDRIGAVADAWHVTPTVGTGNPDPLPAFARRFSASAAAPAVPGEITVAATHAEKDPVPTGIHVGAGQTFVITPNPSDQWSKGAGTHKNQMCDYRGYSDKPGWLALAWKIGNTHDYVHAGESVVAGDSGEIMLYCQDDKPPASNLGSIRATVSASPAQSPSSSSRFPTTAPAAPQPRNNAPDATAAGTPIDLLKLVGPQYQTQWGEWKMGTQTLDCVHSGRVMLLFSPPAEYDLQVAFKRNVGDRNIGIVVPLANGSLMWSIGAVNGFCKIEARNRWHPIADSRAPVSLTNGVSHTCTIRVRKDKVQAFLDDKLDAEITTDGTGYDNDSLKLSGARACGLQSDQPATFPKIAITEITGHGHVLAVTPSDKTP